MKFIDKLKIFAKPKENNPKPQMGEISVASKGDLLSSRYRIPPYNPDALIVKKGIGLDIFDELLKDEQVKACLYVKKQARLSTIWEIEPASDDPLDEEISEFCEWNIEKMIGTLEDNLFEILSAIEYGYSVTELIWYLIEEGDWTGKIGLKALKTRYPHSFDFDIDDYGNLKNLIQTIDFNKKKLPSDKFIIYSYNKEFENWYGHSDLRECYRHQWSKDVIIKFRNMFLEKFGMGTHVGKYPPGTSSVDQDNLLNLIDKIQSRTSIVIPDNVILEILEATRQGADEYQKAIDACDKAIARALLIPDLLGFSGTSSVGSYALGKKHFDIFLFVLDKLGRDIQETIMGEQVIRRLVDFNYANVNEYPRFVFESLEEEDTKLKSEIIIGLKKVGLLSGEEDWIRKWVGIPERAEGIELPPPMKNPLEQQFSKFPRPLTTYEKKVDFSRIQSKLNDFEEQAKHNLSDILIKSRDSLISAITKKRIIEEKNIKDINKLQLKYVGELRRAINDVLMNSFNLGKAEASAEVEKKREEYQFLPKDAIAYFEAKSYYVTGVINDFILKESKQIILQVIKGDRNLKDAIFEIQNFFSQYLTYPEGVQAKEGELLSPTRIETIIRTNVSDAFNEGRRQLFIDPDVVEILSAYQYSAILDGRTTDFCRSWDGFIALISDPIWDTIWAPNHFNCRSLIVPITKYERFEVSEQPNIKPAKGFA